MSGPAKEFQPDRDRGPVFEFFRDWGRAQSAQDSFHPSVRQAPACLPEAEIQNIRARVLKLVGQDIGLANAAFSEAG